MWDRIHHGQSVEDCNELYEDICKLAVLSNVEIDRAKKEFVINSAAEISILKEKYKITDDHKMVKPMFFKMICLENGYKLSDRIIYKYFDTPMDYLQEIVSKYNFYKSRGIKKEVVPFIDIVKEPSTNYKQGFYYKKRDDIIEKIRQAKNETKFLFIDYDTKGDDEKAVILQKAAELKAECVEAIDAMSEVQAVMYLTLKELDNPANKDLRRFIFDVLFSKPNKAFFKMIYESKENIFSLLETDADPDYLFYGLMFKRHHITRCDNPMDYEPSESSDFDEN